MTKPTRSMPKIDQEQGDSMEEGEGQEEWLSDGGFTDDDTIASQDQDVTSSQDEQSTVQDTTTEAEPTADLLEPNKGEDEESLQKTDQEALEAKTDDEAQQMQVEETVENINNQLQLEINIGEDGVAIIRRQAVRVPSVQEKSESPQKVKPTNQETTKPTEPAAATSSTSVESTADEDSVEDPEKLLDQLETFLIRKTDGKVLGTKANVQTTLTDLVKKTVNDDQDDGDEGSEKNNDDDDDGNDTDDLLSVLDDSISRRTRRSLAKLQQADTPSTTKGKPSVQKNKQVTKAADSPKQATPQRRTSTRTSSVSNRKPSQDSKPVILSNKLVQLTSKTASNKKSSSNQKSTLTKSDKNTTKLNKDNLVTTLKADEELIKHFAKKNPENPPQLLSKAIVKVERTEIKKPVMKISNSNFGDTYTTFIQKQSIANKALIDNQKDSNIKRNENPKVYKRKARTVNTKEDEKDPFDKLFMSDDENDTGKSAKIKKLNTESSVKSPITRKSNLDTSKLSKSNIEGISPKISNKANERTNSILSMLEKKSGLSVKSTTPANSNKILSITRKTVTELPKTQSPKIQTNKFQSPKIQTNKVQSPKIQTNKVQSPKIQTNKVQSPNIMTPKTQSPLSNVSNNNQVNSPVGKKFLSQNQTVLGKYSNLGVNKNQNVNTYTNKTEAVDKKELSIKKLNKGDFLSDDEHMASELDDHDMTSMPEWPGEDEDAEEEEKPSEPPQRTQEGILKTGEPIKAKFLDNVMMDGSTEFDSDDIDDSDFEDMSGSESESMQEDFFTIDLRDERAAEYLPLLGAKAEAMLEREKRSLLQKLSTIRQGLKSLQDKTKKNQTEVEMAKLKILELNTLLRQP